jgi:hypothetical protein
MNVELRGKLAGIELGPKMQACNERERIFCFLVGSGIAEFRNLVPRVIRAAERVSEDPKHKHHVPLIISLLSKLGYGERTAVDVNVSGEVQVNHTEAAVDDLRRLKALGVPREKLIEVFGYSGLDRYEAMLSSRAKVIEHQPSEAAPGSIEPRHNPLDGTL